MVIQDSSLRSTDDGQEEDVIDILSYNFNAQKREKNTLKRINTLICLSGSRRRHDMRIESANSE